MALAYVCHIRRTHRTADVQQQIELYILYIIHTQTHEVLSDLFLWQRRKYEWQTRKVLHLPTNHIFTRSLELAAAAAAVTVAIATRIIQIQITQWLSAVPTHSIQGLILCQILHIDFVCFPQF